MVSDIVLVAIFGVVGTLLGALLGLFAEPIRAYFARKARQEQLRRTLYGELFIKLEKATGYALEYDMAITNKDIDYLKSANKLEILGLISFPDEVDAQAQYYQLTSQEFDLLAVAYHRLRGIINLTNKFGSTSFETIDDAKKDYTKLEDALKGSSLSVYFINKAFEDNARVLEKIDNGALLNDWRKLMQQPRMRRYLQDDVGSPAEKHAEKKKRKRVLIKH